MYVEYNSEYLRKRLEWRGAKVSKKDEEQSVNIFDLLSKEAPEEEEAEKQTSRRDELLESMDIEDCFEEGSISIDMRTCKGIECNLCVKVCPTNALYWKAGEIGIIEDLCIHCTACVVNCMVNDCIRVTRNRPDDKTESFSNPKDVLELQCNISSKKRKERVKSM